MSEEHEYIGTWWLPQTPETKVHGVMKFTPKSGAVLDLEDTLSALYEDVPIVLGDAGGKKITLYMCKIINAPLGLSKASTIYARVVFLDVRFLKLEAIKFKVIYLEYSYLNIWAFRNTIQWSRPVQPEIDMPALTVTNIHQQPVEGTVDGLKYTLHWSALQEHNILSAKVTQKTSIIVTAVEPLDFDACLEILRNIQNLLMLAISKAVYPLSFKVLTDASETTTSSDLEIDLWNYPITILQAGRQPESLEDTERLNVIRHYMLFSLADVQDTIDVFWGNVVTKSKNLRTVYNLYATSLYNPNTYLEQVFLSLAQALEIYHRRMHGGKYQSDETYSEGLYKVLVKAIPDGTDHAFRESLKIKLQYAHEFSLRKRVKDTLERMQDAYPIELTNAERLAFAKDVTQIRNDLTHYSSDKNPSLEHINQVAEKIKLLLEACLLTELGLPASLIHERLSMNWRVHQGIYLR